MRALGTEPLLSGIKAALVGGLVLAPLLNMLASVTNEIKLREYGVSWLCVGVGTYTALQGTTVDEVSVHLANGHGGSLVSLHLNEGKAAIGLEPRLDYVSEVLEQRYYIVGCGVGGEVANIAGRLPRRSLGENHVVARHTVGGELVVTERRRRGHAHSLHSLLLSNRGLALLVGPVASDSTRAEPFAVHGAQRLLGISAVAESDKSVTTRSTSLHIPHNSSLRDRTEGGECLGENLIVDFVGQVANEDVEVARGILLARGIRLVGPVDANFLNTSC